MFMTTEAMQKLSFFDYIAFTAQFTKDKMF